MSNDAEMGSQLRLNAKAHQMDLRPWESRCDASVELARSIPGKHKVSGDLGSAHSSSYQRDTCELRAGKLLLFLVLAELMKYEFDTATR